MVQGVINIPLIEDELALRAVAYQFDNSGYIDNVAASQPNAEPGIAAAIAGTGVARDQSEVGSDEYTGFRLTALWQPLDQLSITLGHTYQEIEQDGVPEVNNNLAEPFQQIRLRTGPGGSRDEFLNNDLNITNLVINYDLGWGSVTSSSSWIDYDAASENDLSRLFFRLFTQSMMIREVFIEELRFTSQFDGPFQFWQAFTMRIEISILMALVSGVGMSRCLTQQRLSLLVNRQYSSRKPYLLSLPMRSLSN